MRQTDSGDDKCALGWTVVFLAAIVAMAACFAAWGGLMSEQVGHICTISGMRDFRNVASGDNVDCEMTVDVIIEGCNVNHTTRLMSSRSCETYDPNNRETSFPLWRGSDRYSDASYICYTRKDSCDWDQDYHYNTRIYPLWVCAWVLLVAAVLAVVPALVCSGLTRFNYIRRYNLFNINRCVASTNGTGGATDATVEMGQNVRKSHSVPDGDSDMSSLDSVDLN